MQRYHIWLLALLPLFLGLTNTTKISSDDIFTEIMTTSATKIQQPEKPHGWKSKTKCKDYLKFRNSLGENIPDQCKNSKETNIAGEMVAFPGEFPHMARWGTVINSEPIYFCSASLISEQYLLTAANCELFPKVQHVAKLGDDAATQIIVNITERIPHPDFKYSEFYNNIALLRLEKPVNFTKYISPACLQTDDSVMGKEAIASGWNDDSSRLKKKSLPVKNVSQCKKIYSKDKSPFNIFLPRNIDENNMLCVGSKNSQNTICMLDYGKPLQIKESNTDCTYTIIGVRSFGNECGTSPTVYTRISNFIPWIESIVWPDNVQ